MAVGVGKKEDKKTGMRNQVEGEYPWGTVWPPPQGAGNYSDDSRNAKAPNSSFGSLENFDDGIPTTAPVMSFKPNQFGIYDLGGNVWELLEDKYTRSSSVVVEIARGGSWLSFNRFNLLSSFRADSGRDFQTGFRCVLEGGGTAR